MQALVTNVYWWDSLEALIERSPLLRERPPRQFQLQPRSSEVSVAC